jgi:hypothetical protein
VSNIRFETKVELVNPLELCIQKTYDRLLAYGLTLISNNKMCGNVSIQVGDNNIQVPVVVSFNVKDDQQVKVSVDVLDPPSLRLPRDVCKEIFRKIWEEISLGLFDKKKEVEFSEEPVLRRSKPTQHILLEPETIHIRVNNYCG